MSAHHNTVAGSRLSGNGHVRLVDGDALADVDDAAHVEHHGAWTCYGFECPAQGALGAVVFKTGHVDHLSATSANGIAAEALGTREGIVVDAESKHFALDRVACGGNFVDAPVVGLQVREALGRVALLLAVLHSLHVALAGAQHEPVRGSRGRTRPREGDAIGAVDVQVAVQRAHVGDLHVGVYGIEHQTVHVGPVVAVLYAVGRHGYVVNHHVLSGYGGEADEGLGNVVVRLCYIGPDGLLYRSARIGAVHLCFHHRWLSVTLVGTIVVGQQRVGSGLHALDDEAHGREGLCVEAVVVFVEERRADGVARQLRECVALNVVLSPHADHASRHAVLCGGGGVQTYNLHALGQCACGGVVGCRNGVGHYAFTANGPVQEARLGVALSARLALEVEIDFLCRRTECRQTQHAE